MKSTTLLALACLAPATAWSQSTVITQSQSFGPNVLSFNDTLNFAAYSGSASDIFSVEWNYELNVDGGQLIIDNDGNTAATVNASFGADLTVGGGSLTLLDSAFSPIFLNASTAANQAFNLGPNSGDAISDFDPTGPDGATLTVQNATSTGGGFINSTFFSQYANGAINIDVLADTLSDIGSVGGVELASTPPTANGTITLKITLDDSQVPPVVPEPSSALLGGLGLLALARRKR